MCLIEDSERRSRLKCHTCRASREAFRVPPDTLGQSVRCEYVRIAELGQGVSAPHLSSNTDTYFDVKRQARAGFASVGRGLSCPFSPANFGV